jgi:hypothetical protein
MRSPGLVLLLIPALLSLAATSPDPLTGLKTACERSKDQDSLRSSLQALAPTLGFELVENVEDHQYTLRFRQPIAAARLLKVMGWTRAYAFSGDVHQETWMIGLWTSDVPDEYGPRIGVKDPQVGAWAVTPSLAARPAGDLPNLVAGASPAYDLTAYTAQVTEIEIEPWSPDRW